MIQNSMENQFMDEDTENNIFTYGDDIESEELHERINDFNQSVFEGIKNFDLYERMVNIFRDICEKEFNLFEDIDNVLLSNLNILNRMNQNERVYLTFVRCKMNAFKKLGEQTDLKEFRKSFTAFTTILWKAKSFANIIGKDSFYIEAERENTTARRNAEEDYSTRLIEQEDYSDFKYYDNCEDNNLYKMYDLDFYRKIIIMMIVNIIAGARVTLKLFEEYTE